MTLLERFHLTLEVTQAGETTAFVLYNKGEQGLPVEDREVRVNASFVIRDGHPLLESFWANQTMTGDLIPLPPKAEEKVRAMALEAAREVCYRNKRSLLLATADYYHRLINWQLDAIQKEQALFRLKIHSLEERVQRWLVEKDRCQQKAKWTYDR